MPGPSLRDTVGQTDHYTSPLDDVVQDTDFSFELPDPGSGEIIIVDSDSAASTLSRTILEEVDYSVRTFSSPNEALESLQTGVPTVLLTGFHMPEMSGLDLAQRAQETDPDVRVILLTGSGDETTAQAALRMGVSDYIKKPPDPVTLTRSVQRAFHQRAAEDHHRAMVVWMKLELQRRAEAIREVTVSALAAFANALDMRSPHFHGHSRAVADCSAAIAGSMGLAEVEAIRTAGLLHDVGMMAIPDSLVEKESPLTPEEFAVIRSHCDRGVEILEPMKHLGDSIRFVHEHHERWDGSGYPRGKKANEISLGGQIVGISEAWVAILESRAYRAGMSPEDGFQVLDELRDQWFSSEVTDALRASVVGLT